MMKVAHTHRIFFCAGPLCKTFPGVDVNVKLTVRDGNMTILEVNCLDGFRMTQGSETRECIADDTWSGHNDTVCSRRFLLVFHSFINKTFVVKNYFFSFFTAITCGALPKFPNTTIRISDPALNVGAKAKYSCLPDFTITEGESTSFCLVTGEWSVVNVSCDCKCLSWKITCIASQEQNQ